MVDSVTEISKVLLGQGFQQVPAPLGETIMDITDLSGITAVAYGGKVCVLPQTYQAYLEKQLDNYPTAKGIFTDPSGFSLLGGYLYCLLPGAGLLSGH